MVKSRKTHFIFTTTNRRHYRTHKQMIIWPKLNVHQMFIRRIQDVQDVHKTFIASSKRLINVHCRSCRHTKIKKSLKSILSLEIFLIENECKTHPQDVLHSFPIKNIFYDKMDLRLFYFHQTVFIVKSLLLTLNMFCFLDSTL